MATTRFSDHLLEGDHASRPAASAVPEGTLYSCTTHSLVYQSDGVSTWSTWATLGGGASDLDAIIAASSGQDIADALSGAAAPDAGNVFATMADVGGGGGAIVFLEAHTASSSATLDFTAFISSTYDEYLFELVNVLPATNAADLLMRVGTGGGPTYDSGAAAYTQADWRWHSGGGSAAGGGTASAIICAGRDHVSNNANWAGVSGSLTLLDPGSSVYKKVNGMCSHADGTTAVLEGVSFTGYYTATTVLTAIRFLYSSGNIASGTIRVYGIAKT